MKLSTKLSLVTVLIVIVLSASLEFISLWVFSRAIHSLNQDFFLQKVNQLILLAYEQDELFFEGVYEDEQEPQWRVKDKINIAYRQEKPKETYAFVIDLDGNIVVHPAISQWGEKVDKNAGKQEVFDKKILAFMKKNKEGDIEYTSGGVRKWYVFKVYEPWNWVFCMTTTIANRDKAIVAFTKIALGISIIVIILSVLAVLFMSRTFVRPLNLVIKKLEDIARGDLSTHIDIRASGEMRMLVDSFNKMAGDLQKTTFQLTAEKERLNVTLKSIGDGVIATDIDGKISFMNAVASQLTGWPATEAIGQSLTDVFHIVNERTRQPCENPAERALKLDKIVSLSNDTLLISRDGTERIIVDSGSPIRDNKNRVIGAILVFRDNTEEKKAAQEVRKLYSAVEFSPSTVFITDTKGVIEYVNPKFTEVTGYAREEVVGTTARILRVDKLAPEKHQEIWTSISSGQEWRGEFINKKKNDECYWEYVIISSIKDVEGQITHFLIVTEDITQRKSLMQQLEKEKKDLEIFHKAAVTQELDAIALKKEVNELLCKSNLPIKYREIDEIESLMKKGEKKKG